MTSFSETAQTGADIVVETLEQHGVTHVFGVPGAKIDKVFDRLLDSSITTVVCRHEQNAAFIAGGIGRMTGKAGVAIATSGPGVSNLATGLATAHSEGDPLVALGGGVAVADRLKSLHQTLDSVNVLKPVTKFAAEVDSPAATAEVLSAAFRAAESGRPGSAFVSLPIDVMNAPAACRPIRLRSILEQGAGSTAAIAEAARLIDEATNPVVLLGLMASKPGAANAIRHLLNKKALPVVGTFQAAGALSEREFAMFGGRVGQLANQPVDQLLESADLVVTIGYDAIEYWPSIWNKDNDRAIVHIDVVPAQIENDYNPSVEIIGNIEESLYQLSVLITRSVLSKRTSLLLEQIKHDRANLLAEAAVQGGDPIHPFRIIAELQKFMSPDVTLCSDMGSFSLYLSRYLTSFRARQVLISNGQQTLGVALPWAIAASIVRPTEKVLSVSGDGGFLFSAMELETAVRLRSNLVHMVWIDGSYNMVAAQEELKYGRHSGTDLGSVDVVRYAEAFGAKGFQVSGPDDLATTLRSAFDIPGPVLIGVNVDYTKNAQLFEAVHHDSIL
ncbi:acetolactate synthase AlsS [Aliirhizobium cellulosilyticum]|uniref:Acetolactate synthase-1/2/3 large subunit n=1 Tax=Aliirhizobium cellulosilyticum TaxID=393664 RepID=A0A7W6Y4K4_9HYPH|nr:acetolactate synthase AlsS [Rhizobium cellulosilyticum]MBB4349445.1 acetolactate synthase-1/2/3 large subunit [Rhizobium cellulosilyticum]MBB4412333.1 acetolactate synthase-1/2/3 large subunit [Rhizobium cellulosilyticum]MBB4446964.1 acetolactate synthase-1/2/3 large subunit [Rhizobium cellulosilyticum]